MNLAFPILYVLATIVICGLPMIITPVETAIGLAMILSGNTDYVGHQGTTLEAAHSNMIYIERVMCRGACLLHLCLLEEQARDDPPMVK